MTSRKCQQGIHSRTGPGLEDGGLSREWERSTHQRSSPAHSAIAVASGLHHLAVQFEATCLDRVAYGDQFPKRQTDV